MRKTTSTNHNTNNELPTASICTETCQSLLGNNHDEHRAYARLAASWSLAHAQATGQDELNLDVRCEAEDGEEFVVPFCVRPDFTQRCRDWLQFVEEAFATLVADELEQDARVTALEGPLGDNSNSTDDVETLAKVSLRLRRGEKWEVVCGYVSSQVNEVEMRKRLRQLDRILTGLQHLPEAPVHSLPMLALTPDENRSLDTSITGLDDVWTESLPPTAGNSPPFHLAVGVAPLFFVPNMGDETRSLEKLAASVSDRRGLFVLNTGSDAVQSATQVGVARAAEVAMRALRRLRPHGPYRVAGDRQGAAVVWEMAQILWRLREPVELLVVIDWDFEPPQPAGIWKSLRRWFGGKTVLQPAAEPTSAAYSPQPYLGDLTVVVTDATDQRPIERHWRKLARGRLYTRQVP